MTNWKRSIVPCVASASCLLVPAVWSQRLTVPVQGAEQVTSSGTADLGSLTVTAAGYSESVSFGKFSSAASVASGLAAKFSLDCQSPVSAFAQGAQITFTLKSSGASITVGYTSQWDTADFSASSFSLPNAGGGTPTPTPGQPTSSLSLDCTPDPAPAGAAVSCTAEMPAGVTGSLSFSVDGGPPSQVALSSGGTASLGALSGLTTGSHTVTANYSGDPNYAATNQTATIQVLAGSLQPVPVYSFSITQPGSTTSGYAANGNLTAYTDSVNGQWSLGYDGLNRVTSAGSQGFANQAQQYMCWAYDSFGNRTVEATASSAFGNACSSSNPSSTNQVSYNANNQITGGSALPSAPSYDAGGNVTNDGTNQYLYDGEGRICAVSKGIMPSVNSMVQYIYDADGNRVAKGSIAVFSCDTTTNGFQPTTAYALDQSGRQVTEMTVNNGQSSWAHTNLFTAGGLYATYDPQGLHYQINDWLGTRRVQTDAFGQVEENCQSLPFGSGLNCPAPANAPTTAEDATEHHFTGKERDTETNNDYFGARYYGSSMGRFMSPDPVFISAQRLMDPQSLNLYSYVRNNPLGLTDDTGLDFYLSCQTSDHTGCGQVQNGSSSSWVQGQNVNGSFQAADVDMNKQGDPSAGYSDQFGNNYTGTFDQNNGVSFTNTDTGATSSNSLFIDGSDQTTVNGSGSLFGGTQGVFNSNCGGSCEAKGSLFDQLDHAGAVATAEKMIGKSFEDNLNFLGGHGKSTSYRTGEDQLTHIVVHAGGPTELHFEGHPPGRDLVNFVLHQVDAIRDFAKPQSSKGPPLP